MFIFDQLVIATEIAGNVSESEVFVRLMGYLIGVSMPELSRIPRIKKGLMKTP